ncbi:hypothetical protein [Saccharopolyspora flava]|uniref:Uncharacterized protein n=1 Tax=Saccharopolyspora flava TaxID=95161 RepID=A0A1I6TJV0_9PSEU|nr:hypothetical protein [Saccharopolyspora flava]SFS89436.1 hypothetical protein SAMN05660874_04004 [Saccharopolyspora flava]
MDRPGVNRRTLLAGAALGGAGLASGLLGGCGFGAGAFGGAGWGRDSRELRYWNLFAGGDGDTMKSIGSATPSSSATRRSR